MIRKVNQGIASQPSRIEVPAGTLVVLIGAAASGKSTFAAAHFVAEAVISSDGLRAELSAPAPDDVIFAALHRQVQAKLAAGIVVVIDATNTDWMWRAALIADAVRYGRPAIAIVFNLPLDVCLDRNAARSRRVPASVVRRHVGDVTRDIERLDLEGFAAVHVLRSAADVDAVRVDIEKGPVTRALTS